MPDDATPAEVIEVIGLTGMHGEASQIKCRVLDGSNRGVSLPVTLSDLSVRVTF